MISIHTNLFIAKSYEKEAREDDFNRYNTNN
jgi:hypothetical protein